RGIASVSALRINLLHSLLRLDHPEKTISLLVNPGSKEELVGLARLPTKAEHQSPQAIDDNCMAVLVGELTLKGTRMGIERVDASITEIADQQVIAELAKGTACERQSPGRVQS